MGHFSAENSGQPGSVLSANQQVDIQTRFLGESAQGREGVIFLHISKNTKILLVRQSPHHKTGLTSDMQNENRDVPW
jgi:hypothetical protein